MQRNYCLMLSPRPCRAAPPDLPHRGLPRRSGAEPQARPGRERHSGSRGCRPASALPGRAAAPRVGERGRAGRGPEPAGTAVVLGGDRAPSARQLRWLRPRRDLPVVRTGAAAGGCWGLSGTRRAQGALRQTFGLLHLVFTPSLRRSLAPLCPGQAGDARLPPVPQALPGGERPRPARSSGRADGSPVRRRGFFAMRTRLCQVTLLFYLFF